MSKSPFITPPYRAPRRWGIIRRGPKLPIYRGNVEKREARFLSYPATLSTTSAPRDERLYTEPKCDYRTRFARDRDRIIHSVFFLLLGGKSQVFPVLEGINPITTTRLFHVLRVMQLAIDVGRALGLNEDLIMAIALGHDIGHFPFGHAGEKGIQLATKHDLPYLGGKITHELMALRVLDGLENKEGRPRPGLNLTFQVTDGISRHCGEDLKNSMVPSTEYDLSVAALPTTLEGLLVRLLDVVGYAPQDLRDFMHAEFTSWNEVPANVKKVLGTTIDGMWDTMCRDIIQNSAKELNQGKRIICMSEECFNALKELSSFTLGIILDRFGKKEEELAEMIVQLYSRYKDKGYAPLQIVDHFVRMTDQQLFNDAKSNNIIF